MITRFNMYSVIVHGCPLGMTDAAGQPILKQWRFITTFARLAAALEPLKCSHPKGYRHAEIAGATTPATASYPMTLCHTILSSIFGYMERTPTMARVAGRDTSVHESVVSHAVLDNRVKAGRGAAVHEPTHQESEPVYSPFGASPNLQGCGAVIDLPEDVVEIIAAKGALWEPMPGLID